MLAMKVEPENAESSNKHQYSILRHRLWRKSRSAVCIISGKFNQNNLLMKSQSPGYREAAPPKLLGENWLCIKHITHYIIIIISSSLTVKQKIVCSWNKDRIAVECWQWEFEHRVCRRDPAVVFKLQVQVEPPPPHHHHPSTNDTWTFDASEGRGIKDYGRWRLGRKRHAQNLV